METGWFRDAIVDRPAEELDVVRVARRNDSGHLRKLVCNDWKVDRARKRTAGHRCRKPLRRMREDEDEIVGNGQPNDVDWRHRLREHDTAKELGSNVVEVASSHLRFRNETSFQELC